MNQDMKFEIHRFTDTNESKRYDWSSKI